VGGGERRGKQEAKEVGRREKGEESKILHPGNVSWPKVFSGYETFPRRRLEFL